MRQDLNTRWEVIKWLGNVCYVLSTITMLNPTTASTAVTPWMLFFIGNLIWMLDSWYERNWPWVSLALFFMAWDVVIILTRLYNVTFLQPIVNFFNFIP